jgi:hypothetical protein
MLFRMHDQSVQNIDVDKIDLCEYFQIIKNDAGMSNVLTEYLRTTPFKKYRTLVVQMIEDLCADATEEVTIKELLQTDCKIYRKLRERVEQGESVHKIEIGSVIDHIQENANSIFEPVIFHIKFMKDNILRHVLEFLSIECKFRSENMFDNLPLLTQTYSNDCDFKLILDQCYLNYMIFIEQRSYNDLLDLAKAACLLGIVPLKILTGCRLAREISKMSPHVAAERFKIPPKFKHSVLARLKDAMETIQ